MSKFQPFAAAVKAQFDAMSKHELYVVDRTGDQVWEAYLAAFPEGTNPLYRTRTEHDCSCCKSFIRNLGNVVALVDGRVETVWDVVNVFEPYDVVAATLRDFIRNRPITGLFRAAERKYGAEHTFEHTESGPFRWNHFHATIAARHFAGKEVGKVVGDYRTTVEVFSRGLNELTPEAFETVIELIEGKALYRGEEFGAAVRSFAKLQREYRALPGALERNRFVWSGATNPAVRFRNSAIGSLVTDLSEGVDLERAVAAFESKVAPQNYKRPTALITPRMIKDAMKTIETLGLEPALERRFARMSDITINNVLWADNSARSHMKGGVEGLLMGVLKAPAPSTDKVQSISIGDFVASVLPRTQGLDVFVKTAQQGNFMSLTAPVHAEVEPLFKWPNNFGWSYNGNVTDSIKERVKKAGGSVEGDLCCRLAWDYKDDLDFHMIEPGGRRIYYGCRRQLSLNGGMLDLDANGADGLKDYPAENIFYTDRRRMRDGVYTLQVNNFSRRSDGVGFTVEVEFDGRIHTFAYDQVLRGMATITVAQIECKGGVFRILESLPSTTRSTKVWGIDTERFVKVETLLLSPNHWDGHAIGNKHWFFVLDGCRADAPARGIYNEFLRSDLEAHRKVFEVLGEKTKCPVVEDQLSGVGFSSTRGDEVVVRATIEGSTKQYNIIF